MKLEIILRCHQGRFSDPDILYFVRSMFPHLTLPFHGAEIVETPDAFIHSTEKFEFE